MITATHALWAIAWSIAAVTPTPTATATPTPAPESALPPAFANAAGWVWQLPPMNLDWSVLSSGGLVLRQDALADGTQLLTIAYSARTLPDLYTLQPVGFDSNGQRLVWQKSSSASSGDVSLRCFVYGGESVPFERLRWLGVEMLTDANRKAILAPAAYEKLKAAGQQVLPLPAVGAPYTFSLKLLDGRQITSADLAGKVVLLDFWATWCGPCMAKMPELQKKYDQLHDRGFEIIGINHDTDAGEARRAIAKLALPWPNALAADDRELWSLSAGFSALPYLVLIDREGVVRALPSPHELYARIDALTGPP